MAESKGALIAKSVQKHAGRAKEKLLQNLGKVDRTLDDIFEEHLQNFNRQHQQAVRLQKEFNNYIRCIRAAQTASKSLMEAITEVYESGWSGHDLLYVQAQNMEMLWQDYSHKLGDQVLIPLNTYTNQFPEVRKKVEKRGRKLVDYDSQRHSFQNLQANANKRRDDVKVTKGREQLEEAKRTYEVLNSELHDELPALHESRVLFYVTNLQTLFAAEALFHTETSKVFAELEAITDKLATDCQRGSYKKSTPSLPALPSVPANNNITNKSPTPAHNGNGNTLQTMNGDSPPAARAIPETPPEEKKIEEKELKEQKEDEVEEKEEQKAQKEEPTNNNVDQNGTDKLYPEIHEKIEKKPPQELNNEVYDVPSGAPIPPEKTNSNLAGDKKSKSDEKKETELDKPSEKNDETYDIPVGATLAGLPAGTLYRVRATYRYVAEDSDELSFDVGETIRVVDYDDPDEQEEGWLMGIKETTYEKGMFPANFTRPI